MFENSLGQSIILKEKLSLIKEDYNSYGFRTAYSFHFWGMLHSSSAVVLGFPIYGKHHDKFWFKLTIKPLYNFSKIVSNLNYAFKYRFVKKHKYNTVYTHLKPRYYDTDTIMLHACFALLINYVEREHGGEKKLEDRITKLSDKSTWGEQDGYYNPPEMMQSSVTTDSEVLSLYRWWKVERLNDQVERDRLLKIAYTKDTTSFITDEQTNLIKLIFSQETSIVEARKQLRKIKTKIETDEQTMLHRLIDIRQSLWT